MARIDTIVLGACDVPTQIEFYSEVLGMNFHSDSRTLGYGALEARLHFVKTDNDYQSASHDLYWKIALAVPDIELACRQLSSRGVAIGDPHQFQDIGYLAHFTDPAGYTIELIGHWFQGNRPATTVDSNSLGGGAHLNLLTLRTTDIDTLQLEVRSWGMTPLSIQRVDNYGFTLHFYAFTDESPPDADLESVANREWLYQRPYTVLELQHLHNPQAAVVPAAPAKSGFIEAQITSAAQELLYQPLGIRLST
ncbi:MAG: VOC family protein [Pseudomonadota bacterium]